MRSFHPRSSYWSLLCLLSLLSAAELAAQGKIDIEHLFLTHPTEPERRVELYLAAPRTAAASPAVLFVHGHQMGARPGGRFYVDNGFLRRWAEAGLVAVAVSQPGYGESDGPPDFCGPLSRQAVHGALTALRHDLRVDPDRIVLFGRSRGAVVASRVAGEDDRLAGVILRAGVYDLLDAYARLDPGNPLHAAIKFNMDRESGSSPQALRDRSALFAEPVIRVPTLILHGEKDDRAPAAKARALARRLENAGTPVELLVFSGIGHSIPYELQEPAIEGFLAGVMDP